MANNQISRDRLINENVQSLFYECPFGGVIIIEIQGQIGQLKLICHSGAKDWFGKSKGGKVIYKEMEKQMFGK